jgi:DNA-directed RNA polymerase beta subunit
MGIRKSYARIPLLLETPDLIQIQKQSYRWVCDASLGGGLKELFDEISPIKDFAGTRYELHFPSYGFGNNAEMPVFKDENSFWEYMWLLPSIQNRNAMSATPPTQCR